MPYRICWTTPDNNKICITIPQALIRPWGPPDPPDDPLKQLIGWIAPEDPSPIPWKVDLPILATIDTLVSHVQNGRVREELGKALQDATQQVAATLPAGMRIEKAKIEIGSKVA